jgi:hypothetical protein
VIENQFPHLGHRQKLKRIALTIKVTKNASIAGIITKGTIASKTLDANHVTAQTVGAQPTKTIQTIFLVLLYRRQLSL